MSKIPGFKVVRPLVNREASAKLKTLIKTRKQFRDIRKQLLSRNFEFRTADFMIQEVLEGNQVVVTSLTSGITDGNLIFNRGSDLIYYDELTYTLQIEYFNTDETNEFAETKVAVVSLLDPSLINNATNIFALIDNKGVVTERIPSSPLNPSYRKSVVVIRDTYNGTFVHNSAQEGLIQVNLGSPECYLWQKRVVFRSDGTLPNLNADPQNHVTGVLRKSVVKGARSFKSTYYSDSGRNQPLKTQYDAVTGEVTFGDLVILMIGGLQPGVRQRITVTGRLKFY